MRLCYLLAAAIMTLSVHQDPVTASVGSEVALTGVMSLGFLHVGDTDQSVSDQPRFVRDNNIAEGGKEERGFSFGAIENLAKQAKNKKEFIKLKPAQQDKLLAESDDFMISSFKFADDLKMRPHDMDAQLRTIPEVSDAHRREAVGAYANYLKEIGK